MPRGVSGVAARGLRGVVQTTSVAFALLVGIVAGDLLAPSRASAVPPFDGVMSFPRIEDASGPEEYSWEVQLAENQMLEQIDDQSARVYYEGGQTAISISAGAAHDVEGSDVPTSITVSDGNVLTLTVHHRAGNPKAGGAPFLYPVIAGSGWEGGFQTFPVLIVPPDEQGQGQIAEGVEETPSEIRLQNREGDPAQGSP